MHEASVVGDFWQPVSFAMLCIFTMGGFAYVIKRLVEDVKEMKRTVYPVEAHKRWMTAEECSRCRDDCKECNQDLFRAISEKLNENADTLCDIRVNIGVLMERRKEDRIACSNAKAWVPE